jgi:hypothetical protein
MQHFQVSSVAQQSLSFFVKMREIVILILALLGQLPRWPHNRKWGYDPSGGIRFILLIVLVLVLHGRIWTGDSIAEKPARLRFRAYAWESRTFLISRLEPFRQRSRRAPFKQATERLERLCPS